MPDHSAAEHPDKADRATAMVEVAYDSLIGANSATLLLDGLGRRDHDAVGVTLAHRRGNPVLLWPAAEPLVRPGGVGCAAVLTVPIATGTSHAGLVVFSGRLLPTEVFGPAAERTVAAELTPASIVLEFDDRVPSREHLDLALYAERGGRTAGDNRELPPLAVADHAQAAERLRVHINTHHSGRLVEAVVELTATDAADVAGAALRTIDCQGVTLDWTDTTGGHELALPFLTSVRHPTQLTQALLAVLEGNR